MWLLLDLFAFSSYQSTANNKDAEGAREFINSPTKYVKQQSAEAVVSHHHAGEDNLHGFKRWEWDVMPTLNDTASSEDWSFVHTDEDIKFNQRQNE